MIRRATTIGFLCGLVFLLLGGIAFAQQVPSDQQPPITGGQETASGQVYFYLNGELAGVSRDVAGGSQMAEFALLELVKGPTDEEKATGYVSFIPDGVKLQYSTIKTDQSEYSVSLSNELLGLNGDPEKAAEALAQIEKTLQEVTGIDNIGITVAGQEMGSTPQDAYEALGVAKQGASETTSGSSGGNGLLITIVIILAVLIVGFLIFFFGYMPRRKAKSATATAGKAGKRAKK